MYLKRLELKGFKSFPTKTDIEFKEGITSIVGPNGSGKSNISDAIRWVLGEQSIKSLRGEKLEDVIFAGSDDKKPMNYCEVALTIDNTDNKLNLDFSEITIKRRAYRNGESSFFLNNKSCRLKDIKEILLDTGIGKDGYSIIEQGKVDEILSNNPLNRRKVFDEACGISKFRYKKHEAQKNLKNTKDNLERINDIYVEIENQLAPLETQQQKALLHLEFSKKLKIIEVNKYIREIDKLEYDLKESCEHIKLLESQSIEIENKKNLIDKEYLNIDKELEDTNENISKLQDYINGINSVISKKDSQISLINERIRNYKIDIERNIRELKDTEKKIETNESDLNILDNNKVENEKEIECLTQKLEYLDKLNNDNKESIQNIGDKIENLKDEIISILNNKQGLSNKLSALIANKENVDRRKENIDIEINELNHEISLNDELLKKTNEFISEKNQAVKKLKNDICKNNDILSKLNLESNKISKLIQNNSYDLNNYNSKLNIYIDMENHNEGFNKGVKEVLKNKNLKGIHGALGQIITVDEVYEKSIEASLGAYVQNIITEDEYKAKDAISYLKKNNLGRVTFLPLNIIKGNKIDDSTIKSSIKIIGIASNLVKYDFKYKNIIENVLGRTIIIDNIDNAIKFSKQTNNKYKVVTLDGEILNPGGSLTGGSFKSNANILSRKRLINECREKIEKLKLQYESMLVKEKDCKEDTHNTNELLNKLENDLRSVEKEIIIETSNQSKLEQCVRDINFKLSKLENEKNGLDSNLNYILEKIENINKEIIELNNKHNKNKLDIETLNKEAKDSNGTYEHNKIKYDELNLKLATIKQKYENILVNINRNINEIKQYKTKLSQIQSELDAKNENIQNEEKNISIEKIEKENLNKQVSDSIRNLENKKAVKINLKQNIDELNEESKLINRRYMELKESLFKVESKIERIKSTNESYTNKLYEEYEMSIEEAKSIKDDSIDIDKKELESLKKEIRKLGNVNIDSIKEYEEVKERYDFYSEQKYDLEESIKTIEKLIDELEKNMKAEFKVKFNEINENFKYVYKRLFGGGHGELTIVDESNILESDIEITAQPPGKKMKSLNLLSGGEKALTAISILFSILLAKPTPFCILDEIEAPLDDANIYRFGEFLKELSQDTQFIAVTHRRGTMDASNYIYGVTMQQRAISKVLSLNLNEVDEITDVI